MITEKQLNEISELTDCNDHNQARLELAKIFKYQTAQKVFEGIITIQLAMGEMDHRLVGLRDSWTNALIVYIGAKYGVETANKVKNCL